MVKKVVSTCTKLKLVSWQAQIWNWDIWVPSSFSERLRLMGMHNKGSETGLSMSEVGLRPLSSTETEGEQEGEQREQRGCSLSRG